MGACRGMPRAATEEGCQEAHIHRHFLQKDLSDTGMPPEGPRPPRLPGPPPPAQFGRPAVRPGRGTCCRVS